MRVRVSHKSFAQECPARVSRESVPQECPTANAAQLEKTRREDLKKSGRETCGRVGLAAETQGSNCLAGGPGR